MVGSRDRPDFSWRWIGRSVLLRRRQATTLLAMTGVVFAVGLVFPIAAQKAVDAIVSGRAGLDLVGLALASLVATIIEAAVSRRRQTLVTELATFIDRRIARRLFAHLLRVRIDGSRLQAGSMINHFQCARKIQAFVLNDVPRLLFEVGSATVSLVLMFYYDVFIGVVVLLSAPVVILVVRSSLGTLTAYWGTFHAATGAQQDVLSETVGGIATTKALADEGLRMRRWTVATDRMLAALAKLMDLQRRFFVTSQVASRLIALLVVAIGCVELYRHRISVGDLLALQLLTNKVTGPLLQSSDIFNRYQEVTAGMREITSFLAIRKEAASIQPPRRRFAGGGIALRGVSLTYPGASVPALRGLDIALPEKGLVAIVGRNGSGKSTLVRVLIGLNQTYEGLVAVGGHDLRSYDPRWYRTQVGIVEQDTVLFSGTVRANLAGGRPVDDRAIRSALDFSGAVEIVDRLRDGLETELTAGHALSGGQRQRLAVARAVARDPRIVLLDEPAAFLDPEAAVALEKRLAAWGRDRLLILVSHHLAAIRGADRILVMDEGLIVGDGRHDTLLEACPTYAGLWANYSRDLEG